jgi:hypothetical protein
MSENIKKGSEIETESRNAVFGIRNKKKWVSLDWLKKQIQMQYDESDNLPGDVKDIRDFGRMDSLRWVLSLLEENK